MRMINNDAVEIFRKQLFNEEKAEGTIARYIHSLELFLSYLGEEPDIDKQKVVGYKNYLSRQGYRTTTVNAMLAALNHYFELNGMKELKIGLYKLQQPSFRNSNKELSARDFEALLSEARRKDKRRLYLIMLTIAMTGIRISELACIRREDLETGIVFIYNKGKGREVILPDDLREELKAYCLDSSISYGLVFQTKKGNAPDKRNVLREMKELGEAAGIHKDKLFPHNLRHLFAVEFYAKTGNLSTLSDILGHASINTTRIYTMQSMEQQKNMMNSLGLYQPYRPCS